MSEIRIKGGIVEIADAPVSKTSGKRMPAYIKLDYDGKETKIKFGFDGVPPEIEAIRNCEKTIEILAEVSVNGQYTNYEYKKLLSADYYKKEIVMPAPAGKPEPVAPKQTYTSANNIPQTKEAVQHAKEERSVELIQLLLRDYDWAWIQTLTQLDKILNSAEVKDLEILQHIDVSAMAHTLFIAKQRITNAGFER